jgi:hypothetical protein
MNVFGGVDDEGLVKVLFRGQADIGRRRAAVRRCDEGDDDENEHQVCRRSRRKGNNSLIGHQIMLYFTYFQLVICLYSSWLYDGSKL